MLLQRALIILLGGAIGFPLAINSVVFQALPTSGQPVVWSINLGSLAIALAMLAALVKFANAATRFHRDFIRVMGQHNLMWCDFEERQPQVAQTLADSSEGGD